MERPKVKNTMATLEKQTKTRVNQQDYLSTLLLADLVGSALIKAYSEEAWDRENQ